MLHAKSMLYIASMMKMMALTCLLFLNGGQSHAAWFEAKGQAKVIDGNRAQAKRVATEEALKQAMLFAGASIQSVHTLTNGLLENEEMTIRSTGEVERLELIDEVYSDGMVTVSVRADIFPKMKTCSAQNDEKHFSSTHFLVRNRQQLAQGSITHFDEAVTQRFAETMRLNTQAMKMTHIAPHTAKFKNEFTDENVRTLSTLSNTQFVVVGTIDDLSITTEAPSVFLPWANGESMRNFRITLRVYDGVSGGQLFSNTYQNEAPWEFDRFEIVDEFSAMFWRTQYGKAIDKTLQTAILDIQETVACQPVTGRVLGVTYDKVSVSLGRDNGIDVNDELFLYQAQELTDSRGRKYLQYKLYPGTFVVKTAYAKSSTLVSKEEGIIANIQEQDFVVKK